LHTAFDQANVTQFQADLADTKKQLATLQASVVATPDRAAAYAASLSQLSQTVRDGKPFDAELKTAIGIGGKADAFAPLVPFAAAGMPSVDALAGSFDAIKPELVTAMTPKPAEAPANAGVMDRMMASPSRVVTVTREGDGSPNDPDVPIGKISLALHHGDLAAAIAAFKALPAPAQQAGATWLSQASGVLDALTLIKAESNAALQKFSGQ